MDTQDLNAAQDALLALKEIAGTALVTARWQGQSVPQAFRMTRTELAYGLKQLQHADLVHYLRCDASHPVLLMVREAAELAISLLDRQDLVLLERLKFAVPYRHHLYSSVLIAALLAAERDDVQKEMAFWRPGTMRIVQGEGRALVPA